MSNVISLDCTCDYLVKRAEKHRCAGRYDEAMALLWKARNQFGLCEDVELQMARVYDEIGCDEEAARAYLRIVRLDGIHKAQALFQLSLTCAQHGDIVHAVSYFEHFGQCRDREEVSAEMAELLARQLDEALNLPKAIKRKKRARLLEQRAASRLQAGKALAAKYCIRHAITLAPNAQRNLMLACCDLLTGNTREAVHAAEQAHALCPSDVQALCVLCDAYTADGDVPKAKKALYLASARASQADDFLAAAIESAKLGYDQLTLLLTARLLRREPFHTRAMLIRACALANCGQRIKACRILGRLCRLLPENTVCDSYYRILRSNKTLQERLVLGNEVLREEAIQRAAELISFLYISPEELVADPAKLTHVCRLCQWAIHSQVTGMPSKTVALILLGALNTPDAEHILLDALMCPALPDALKMNILQTITSLRGFKPYYVDLGGKLVRLAAGAVSNQPVRNGEANSSIVQRASDALSDRHPNAPQALLEMYLAYLDAYGKPAGKHESVCVAALKYQYYQTLGKAVSLTRIARMNGVSPRLLRVYVRRFDSAQLLKHEKKDEKENHHEVH